MLFVGPELLIIPYIFFMVLFGVNYLFGKSANQNDQQNTLQDKVCFQKNKDTFTQFKNRPVLEKNEYRFIDYKISVVADKIENKHLTDLPVFISVILFIYQDNFYTPLYNTSVSLRAPPVYHS